jgi:hypothetical protein
LIRTEEMNLRRRRFLLSSSSTPPLPPAITASVVLYLSFILILSMSRVKACLDDRGGGQKEPNKTTEKKPWAASYKFSFSLDCLQIDWLIGTSCCVEELVWRNI